MSNKVDNTKKLDEIMSTPGIREALAFLNGQMDPQLSSIRGKAFAYRMSTEAQVATNVRMIQMEHSQAIN